MNLKRVSPKTLSRAQPCPHERLFVIHCPLNTQTHRPLNTQTARHHGTSQSPVAELQTVAPSQQARLWLWLEPSSGGGDPVLASIDRLRPSRDPAAASRHRVTGAVPLITGVGGRRVRGGRYTNRRPGSPYNIPAAMSGHRAVQDWWCFYLTRIYHERGYFFLFYLIFKFYLILNVVEGTYNFCEPKWYMYKWYCEPKWWSGTMKNRLQPMIVIIRIKIYRMSRNWLALGVRFVFLRHHRSNKIIFPGTCLRGTSRVGWSCDPTWWPDPAPGSRGKLFCWNGGAEGIRNARQGLINFGTPCISVRQTSLTERCSGRADGMSAMVKKYALTTRYRTSSLVNFGTWPRYR